MGSSIVEAGKRWSAVVSGLLALTAGAGAQISFTPLTFSGMTTVGNSSQPVTATLTARSSGILTSLVALTGGSPNLDFAVTPITCAINTSLTAGESCTVSVVFSPRYAGVRQGAVVAKSGNQLLASTPLSGVGEGSLPVLVPGTINTVAGDGDWIYQRDGIPATEAPIFLPSGLAVDAAGDLFLCDSSNQRVRRVDATTGYIATVAGNGSPGATGDGGQAIAAELNNPSGLAIDGAGDLYIADSGNNVVRRVDAISGVISTFAGEMGAPGYAGDGGAATSALLTSPHGLAFTPGGDLVITDSGNNAIRLVSITSNQIQTIAGTGVAGYNQDGIAATRAELNDPYGVAVRSDGAIAIADLENQRVRLVDNAGVISTAAGTGQRNAGTPQEEQLDGPADVAFDPAGDLFIADAGNNRVRVILTTGAIQTLVGTGSEQFGGDGGPANQASLYGPYALFFDAGGNMWLSDTFHNRVREISGSFLGLTYSTIKVGNVSPPVVETLYNQGNADLTLNPPVLGQAALDPGTTTCNQSTMAPAVSCNMGVEFAPTQVGANITGSIRWPSNAPNVTPVDSLNGEVLSVDVTSVALFSNANPGLLGQPITLTAVVDSDDSGRTGTVTFLEGSNTWCSGVTINSSGRATCVIASLSLGAHTFTASYSGDANNAASTSPAYTETIKQRPALVLSVSSNPAVVTSNVTLTLTAVDQSGTATGTVVFYDGVTVLGTLALNTSGIVEWSTTAFSVGTHALSAQYAGDSANISGTSNTVNEQITLASTVTALALSVGTATVGTAVRCTATVTNNNGPALTGSVTFKDGTAVLGSVPLASGISSLTVTTLAPGNHGITAAYSGDTDDAPSNSASMTETIEQIATVTTLGSDANPINAGATLHLTANVSLAPGARADGALTGSVSFRDGSTLLGTVAINSSGQAILAISTLSVGSHSLAASFTGNTNYSPGNSPAVGQTVEQTTTQTTLSSASSTTLVGKPASFSVAVTSATGTPAGRVTFRDGTTVLGIVTLSATGSAAFSTATLTRGTHSITAAYGGDSNYVGSVSAAQQQIVQLAQPTLTLTGPANAVDAGTVASFAAALTTPGISPTGTLILLNGSSTIATATVSGDGSFTFAISTLRIGSDILTASYSGDADNTAAASQSVTVVVRQASSITLLTTSVDPLTQGSALTLTATVTSDSPNAGGQVRFLDGPTVLRTTALGTNGVASLSPVGLGLGTHSITAVYSGDTNHAGSTSAPLTELVVQGTLATLTSNNNPAPNGQNVTFTAEVGEAGKSIGGAGQVVPTGSVTFRDNGTLLAASTLDSVGAATFTTSTLTVGAHSITMSYAGDANFAGAAAQLTQTVIEANTQVTMTASANPVTFAQPLTLVATVGSNGATATGTVSFVDAGTKIGSAQLNASGVATLTLSTLAPGPYTVVAEYAGDAMAGSSASPPLTFSVKQTTALVLSANSNPGLTLNSLSFTATLTNAGAALATGTIDFTDGGTAIGTAAVNGTGHATLTLPAMSAGSHAIVASYAGDAANFGATSAAYSETVQLRPTSTTVTGSATDPANPQRITLIAVVEGQGSVAPSGTVSFGSGNSVLGQAPIGATGVATITVVFTQTTQLVTVSYPGDVNYAASQFTATINAAGAAGAAAPFTLSVSAPAVTLVSHQHTTLTVNIASANSFTDTIALGCLGLPNAGTCTFTPSQVTLAAGGTATASLLLDTGNPLGAGSGTNALLAHGRNTFLCWLPLGLLAGLLRNKQGRAARRNLGMLLTLAVAIALAIGVSGCSGLTTAGTAPGTYTFKVVGTGQSSGITETQTITLVVTQ